MRLGREPLGDSAAIIWAGAFVGPVMIRGITDASATRKPEVPCTRRIGSTTASLSTPILHVPTGCPKLAEASHGELTRPIAAGKTHQRKYVGGRSLGRICFQVAAFGGGFC